MLIVDVRATVQYNGLGKLIKHIKHVLALPSNRLCGVILTTHHLPNLHVLALLSDRPAVRAGVRNPCG
jgi:hypothetical protein